MKKIVIFNIFLLVILLMGCTQRQQEPPFDYFEWEPTYGESRNNESFTIYDSTYSEENFKIQPVAALQDSKREDFMMGVDASFIKKVLDMGGKYYNEEGVEQDVFEIMALNGVNYLRVRVWNDPNSPIGIRGGGDLNLENALWIAQKARRVNMRIILNLHYSDEWADPEKQFKPYAWELLNFQELTEAVKTFTYDAVTYFKDRGVTPQMIQIGNEINHGLIWPDGQIFWNDPTSYDRAASLLKAGIEGAKEADRFIKTIIHLADGGKTSIFESFFDEMAKRNVNYDIIGASFYPFYHGSLESLADNLNTISAKYNKQVFVAETSYAFTHRSHDYASNIFGPNQEENGGYLATIQGQATAMRDIIEVVANVPNNLGLGICYWEPAWLPVPGAGWAEVGTRATWSNQALFTYNGRVLPSIRVFKDVRGDQKVDINIIGLKDTVIDVNLNIASQIASESKMPTQVISLTDVDSYVFVDVVWNNTEKLFAEGNIGQHTVAGTVAFGNLSWNVTANVRSIQNYVVNSGFELDKTSSNDEPVKLPWVLESTTSDLVGKIQTNKDFRTGMNNFNFYHTAAFNFRLYQDINLPNGTYELSAYVMGESNSKIIDLYLFAENYGSDIMRQNITVVGWSGGYVKVVITNIVITNGQVRVGVYGNFNASTWGHIDDFELTRIG